VTGALIAVTLSPRRKTNSLAGSDSYWRTIEPAASERMEVIRKDCADRSFATKLAHKPNASRQTWIWEQRNLERIDSTILS